MRYEGRKPSRLPSGNLSYGPMTGDRYEGLTSNLLDRAVFDGPDLRVVDGKITNASGKLSDQIDCMLVHGEGTPIPYTTSFIYRIGQVLAVVEVKKTLYSTKFDDAGGRLRQPLETICAFPAREPSI